MHRVKHLIGSKGSVVNKIMTRTGTGIVVEAEVIPAFTRVNKSAVDAQIVSIKGSKEGTIIAQVSETRVPRLVDLQTAPVKNRVIYRCGCFFILFSPYCSPVSSLFRFPPPPHCSRLV